ncbi:MAG TPA: preprotein translocase subunit SecG [Planctomycetaceae bacterium]|nr:preprotein translocase subunit SecG [Planctomycetaceae bacterium]
MFWAYLSTLALLFVGLLLIMIILLQRGRGGGLAGAFGGLGGQSAFGTRAGDVFTRITVVLAVIWVALAGVSIWALEKGTAGKFQAEVREQTPSSPPVETAPATDADETALPDAGGATETAPGAGLSSPAEKTGAAETSEEPPAETSGTKQTGRAEPGESGQSDSSP